MDEATSPLPHCKDTDHVDVTVLGDHVVVPITVTYVEHLACKNTDYTGPGLVLSRSPKKPLDGLHLLPGLVAVMPDDLRTAADMVKATKGMHTVAITHTDNKVYVLFGAMKPKDARVLAGAIEAAWPHTDVS